MTTPTRSMARMAHSPPSPPAARLGQDSDSLAPPTTSPSRLPPVAASVVSTVLVVWVGHVAASTVLVVWVGHVAASTVLVAGHVMVGHVVVASVCGLALVVVAGSVISAVSTERDLDAECYVKCQGKSSIHPAKVLA